MDLRITVALVAVALTLAASVSAASASAAGQASSQPSPPAPAAPASGFVPQIGQEGKDVVWVPTSPALVEAMLDLAKVTPDDFVMDLGSGDGRNIIAAAKRGARGLGVEFNPDMVALSRRLAREAGVADRAEFVEGDMYEADISKATVLALFLLPHNLDRLKDKLLALPAGTRIVMNTFTASGWEADERLKVPDCTSWCEALLHIVPARIAGTWRFGDDELVLDQDFQIVRGRWTRRGAEPVAVTGRLRGRALSLDIAGRTYAGTVDGDRIAGTTDGTTGASSNWIAVRVTAE